MPERVADVGERFRGDPSRTRLASANAIERHSVGKYLVVSDQDVALAAEVLGADPVGQDADVVADGAAARAGRW